MSNARKVLVLDCNKNGYGVISSLGSHKYYVIACDTKFSCPSFKSKYVSERYLIPNIRDGEEAIIDELIDISSKHSQRIFLIPTNDIYLNLLNKHWNRLKHAYIPCFEVCKSRLDAVGDKKNLAQLADLANVPCPRTYASSGIIESNDIFPVVLKPSKKTVENIDTIPFRIKVFYDRDSLIRAEQLFIEQNVEYIIQQYIPGEDDQLHTGGIVSVNGKIYASCTGKKIRQYPPTFGVCAYGILTNNREVARHAENIIALSGISGISQVEFKYYRGKYYIMEINPRIWLWNSLMTYSGVNLPHIFISSWLDSEYKYVSQKLFRGSYMSVMEDLYYNVLRHKNTSIFAFLRQYIFANKYSFGSWRDPLPALMNLINNIFHGLG